MSRYERKIKDGAVPFLEPGEEILSAVIAAPRGYTQSVAGSMNLGSAQQGRAVGAAEQVDLRLEAPMALALTQRRLLTLNVGTPIGLGIGGKVKKLLPVRPPPVAQPSTASVRALVMGDPVGRQAQVEFAGWEPVVVATLTGRPDGLGLVPLACRASAV